MGGSLNKPSHRTPNYATAIVSALNFSSPQPELLSNISDQDWERALEFCDRSHLTLALYSRCRDYLPAPIHSRLEKNFRDNAERWDRLKTAYRSLYLAFSGAGLNFVVLKGFTQWPLFVDDPRHRAQYDIDLLFLPNEVEKAQAVAAQLGYEPATMPRSLLIDHLPTLTRKTGWEWRGDYFDPEMPTSLELHFQCWDRSTEHFGPDGIERDFWGRTEIRQCEDVLFRSLNPSDSLLYSALHTLRHLLRGDFRPSHLYEMGWLLHSKRHDDSFWAEWENLFGNELREPQAICFAMAHRWFSCTLHPTASEAIALLPEDINRWLNHYAFSPLSGMFRPNKDELWLHWSLVKSRRAGVSVLIRRLFPNQLPGPITGLHTMPKQVTFQQRVRQNTQYLSFLFGRIRYHLGAIPPVTMSGARWFIAPFLGRLRLQSSRQEP